MTESLEKRRQRLAQVQARLQKLEAEVKTAERKRETQKLIILGRFLQELLRRGIVDQRVFDENLDKFLVRNYDRGLFGLEEIPEQEQPKTKKKTSSKQPKPTQPATRNVTNATPVEYGEPVKSTSQQRKLVESSVSEEEFAL